MSTAAAAFFFRMLPPFFLLFFFVMMRRVNGGGVQGWRWMNTKQTLAIASLPPDIVIAICVVLDCRRCFGWRDSEWILIPFGRYRFGETESSQASSSSVLIFSLSQAAGCSGNNNNSSTSTIQVSHASRLPPTNRIIIRRRLAEPRLLQFLHRTTTESIPKRR